MKLGCGAPRAGARLYSAREAEEALESWLRQWSESRRLLEWRALRSLFSSYASRLGWRGNEDDAPPPRVELRYWWRDADDASPLRDEDSLPL